ncbi:MAG: T9SS type A sorting domain-containing protein, partial [Bacteroidales bacterium]|nr:T9SS type A sorting domain-containing protein [Bacteroidales bacterium]
KAPFTRPDNPYTPELEHAGGDAFDISWAVDADGNYIELDRIHFVKVHTGVMDGAGWLGQISTEITGAAVAEPDAAINGSSELLVIREIPPVLTTTAYQMEAFAFRKGRLLRDEPVSWSASQPDAYVDENGLLHLEGSSGELTLTAAMSSNEEVHASVTTTVELAVSAGDRTTEGQKAFTLYPNPANSFITIEWVATDASGTGSYKGTGVGSYKEPGVGSYKGTGAGPIRGLDAHEVVVFDLSGKQQLRADDFSGSETVDISALSPGIYLLEVQTAQGIFREKFVKQ